MKISDRRTDRWRYLHASWPKIQLHFQGVLLLIKLWYEDEEDGGLVIARLIKRGNVPRGLL